jgi:hypothetical protein
LGTLPPGIGIRDPDLPTETAPNVGYWQILLQKSVSSICDAIFGLARVDF